MENAPANPLPSSSSPLMSGLLNMGLLRQIALMAGIAASVAVGVAVVLWSQEAAYAPLDTDLAAAGAGPVVDLLEAERIDYRIDPRSGALLVPSAELQRIKLKLSNAGLLQNATPGYELLDREAGFGSSQFIESTRYKRGLEGELARTISSMYAVKGARVHLALPRSSVFVRDARKPRASVLIEIQPGRRLAPEQTAAIVNLVASSVPELEAEEVTVVDQNGRLMSRGEESNEMALAAHQFEYSRKLEQVLLGRVERVLAPIVGLNHFTAEVDASVDFTEREQTNESYAPERVLRSEQVLEERALTDALAGGVPGALSNQPPAAGRAPEIAAGPGGAGPEAADAGRGRQRSQATKNYELDRTLSHTRHQVGTVQRVSVAVVVDHLPSTGVAETSAAASNAAASGRRAWTPEELDRLTELVKGAVGYDAARGDQVQVVNTPFVDAAPVEPIPSPGFWTQPWFWDLAKQMLGLMFVLLLALGVLRPVLKNLTAAGQRQASHAETGTGDEVEGLEAHAEQARLALADGAAKPGLLTFQGQGDYQQQLDAVKGLVSDDPGRVAQVVRKWVNDHE